MSFKTNKFKEKIKNLSSGPGVYLFKNNLNKIIYIGKATSLKNRVSSYFSGLHNIKTEKLILQIKKIEIKKTPTNLEALILEANLIKKYKPKYNIQLKDDKSFSFFIITNEDFPRVLILRKTDLAKNKNIIKYQFGPYTSKKQMLIALNIIKKILPFHSLKEKSEKRCFDYQIGRCPGPYNQKINKKDYAKNIRGIKMILSGKKNNLLKKMELEMKKLAKFQKFELAIKLRNKIFALQHIQDIALITNQENIIITDRKNIRIEAYDISNISGQFVVGSLVVFNNDIPDKKAYRKFKIKYTKSINDIAMMQEVLERRIKNNWMQPDLILLDGGRGHLNMAKKIFNKNGFNIPIFSVAKGINRKKIILNKINYSQKQEKIEKIIGDKNLLGNIMDEAHRFALQYHRRLRKINFKK